MTIIPSRPDKRYQYQQYRRFPYFKIQWYDPVSLCWRDVQKAYPTPIAAEAAFLPGKQCRVMQINETERVPR